MISCCSMKWDNSCYNKQVESISYWFKTIYGYSLTYNQKRKESRDEG